MNNKAVPKRKSDTSIIHETEGKERKEKEKEYTNAPSCNGHITR